jgi:alginate O-acetyltransferase complex protein AlgI
MIVMFIGGLWHGAAWTFVVWGLIHGVLLVIERLARAIGGDAPWTEALPVKLALGLATYAGVCLTWVFFRASDFSTASRLVHAMVGLLPNGDPLLTTRALVKVGCVSAGLLLAHWSLRDTSVEAVVARMPRWLVTILWTLMLGAIILTQGNGNAFIYFQF